MKKVIEVVRTSYCTYQLERVWCGKETCTKCPHGPYWYAYLRVRVKRVGLNGVSKRRVVIKYIGRDFRLLKGDQGRTRSRHKIRADGQALEITE